MSNLSIIEFFPLVSMVFIFSLGLIVLSKNKKTILNKLFFLVSLVFAVWMIGTFMMFLRSEDDQGVVFWDRFIYLGVVFMPALEYHFSLVFTFINKRRKFMLYFGYLLSFLFLILSRTNYFVDGIFRYQWGVHTEARLFHHFFIIFFFFYIFSLLYNLFCHYRKTNSKSEKIKLIYVLIGFSVLNLVGGLAYLPAYKVPIYSPISLVAPLIFSILMAYAIIRHRFLDIKFVLRKSSVYFFSLLSIFTLIIISRFIMNGFVLRRLSWSDLVVTIIAVMIFPSIRNFFYKLANKYFFSSLYDSRQVIADISDKLNTTLDVDRIYGYIYASLNEAFHLKSFGILKLGLDGENYVAHFNRGFKIGEKKRFPGNKLLHRDFIAKGKIIITEEIEHHLLNKETKPMVDVLKKYGVELLAPLNVGNKTVGLIALGQKESKDMYNDEDIQVLEIIGSQAAMAIQNALQYETTKNFNVRLQKEVEEATKDLRHANKKLKQLDRAKTEFLSIASHQLRAPLTAIKGFASLLLDGSYGEISKEQKDVLTKVFDSNERLSKLTENLLNISRIESGRLTFGFEKSDIGELVNGVVDELRMNAENKDLYLKYENGKKIKPFIFDKSKMHEVVMNIIDNAIKYTERGGISIRIEEVKDEVRIIIQDTGIGIRVEDKDYVFKKFQRGHSAKKIYTEGAGIGLYIVNEVLKAHKAKLIVDSDGEGKGSKFTIVLSRNFKPKEEDGMDKMKK